MYLCSAFWGTLACCWYMVTRIFTAMRCLRVCKGTAYFILASDTAIQGLQYADGYRYHFILWSEHVRSMLAHACFVLPRRIFIRLLFTAALVLAYPSQSACNCSFMDDASRCGLLHHRVGALKLRTTHRQPTLQRP